MQEWEDMVGNSSIRLKTAYGKDSKEIKRVMEKAGGDPADPETQKVVGDLVGHQQCYRQCGARQEISARLLAIYWVCDIWANHSL